MSALSHSQSDDRISFEEAVSVLAPALGLKKKGDDYVGAPCPACKGGTTDRFHLKRCPTTGNAWLLCNAGCRPRDIWKGLYDQGFFQSESILVSDIKRQHEYYDPNGVLWGRKTLRYDGKDSWERYESGSFHYGVKNLSKTYPYRANHLHEQDTLFLTEGEKDADTLVSLGYNATSHQSLSNWDWDWFRNTIEGKQLILVRDQDQSGIEQLKKFVGKCKDHGIANNFEVLTTEFGEEGSKTDITDWMQTHSHEELALEIDTAVKSFDEWLSVDQPIDPMGILTREEKLNLPIPPFLVDKLLPTVGVSMIYGESQTYKSFGAIAIADAVKYEQALFGFSIQKNVDTLFILGEDFHNYHERVQASDEYHNRILSERYFNGADFELDKESSVDRLIEEAKSQELDIGLIFVDTLATVWGDAEENSNTDATRLINNAFRIANSLECHVILIHHMGHKKGTGKPRGASAFFNNCTAMFQFSTNDNQPNQVSIVVRKNKHGPNDKRFLYDMHQTKTNGNFLVTPVMDIKKQTGNLKEQARAIYHDVDGDLEQWQQRVTAEVSKNRANISKWWKEFSGGNISETKKKLGNPEKVSSAPTPKGRAGNLYAEMKYRD